MTTLILLYLILGFGCVVLVQMSLADGFPAIISLVIAILWPLVLVAAVVILVWHVIRDTAERLTDWHARRRQ